MAENIEYVVIDCSAILAKLMPDEKIRTVFEEDFNLHLRNKVNFISLNLLVYELLNAIKSSIVSKRIDREYSQKIISNFLKWDINMVNTVNYEDVVDLAILHKLSVYDASYLFLAKKYKCRLMTLDKRLEKAWQEEVKF